MGVLQVNSIAYELALSHSLLSVAAQYRLIEAFGNAQAAWCASPQALKQQLTDKQFDKLSEAQGTIDPDELMDTYHRLNIQVLTHADDAYPPLLQEIHHPPRVLYIRGNVEVLCHKGVSVVGTRRYSDYGASVTNTLLEEIAPYGPCVFSGLAEGIDAIAHSAALKHGLPTVAVFGTGIDVIYPSRHDKLANRILESGGALVSEYPLGTRASKFTFPERNRIVAGLSQGTLVVEGNKKSGALITARLAMEQNRQVMAVPGNVFSPQAQGPNYLIQQGATPVCSGQDVIEAMNWDYQPQQTTLPVSEDQAEPSKNALEASLTDVEKSLLAGIGYEAITFDNIQSQCPAMSVTELNQTLTMLEIYGLITALPGTQYVRR